ncbi:NACHT domain-containing protein [Polaribacter sp. Z022]|uniref:NACHT domain-containing protein n=1 Tax=Polaribacter sp. Z022 TaxID=2927125 RepID=UPI0020201566|nr:NACHT domain-containing protein [Polaribacter sp. Z022]MCL7753106.1 NACHT domain-containing protein [Polaribacter sp. Z022]
MKENPIIITFKKAKEEGALVYFKDLQRAQIMNCLLDFLNNQDLKEKEQPLIINYFPSLKTINEIKTNCKPADFRPIVNFLKEGTSPNRHGIFPLTKLLLEFDISKAKNSIEFIQQKFETTTSSIDLIKHLREFYLNDTNFNSIKVNGNIDNKLGVLSMDDYYIQLSYTSYEDIDNRDSLLKLEKECAYSKVNKSKANSRNLSKDYISDSILANNKIIVSGNPGVGKSTYAKWLCYKWAKDAISIKKAKLLIYIQLRDVNFNNEDFILSYINHQYFSALESELTSLQNLSDFQLMLDGFDELSFENRIKLSSQIKNYNYIVLSRPYGLINHELNYDVSLQIDGFNDICTEQYLDAVLNNQQKKEKLLRLIDKNRVLKDYSSNPLMLSYIALIYVVSKSIEKDLSSIKSIYDLQEKVYSWILDYSFKKGSIKPKLFQKSSKLIEKFSYQMQINKQFVYSGRLDDKHSSTVEILSSIGLGSQKRSFDDPFSWLFSFHTITFQEFLAARYLKEQKLNVEAIVYLVTDSFFWNLCIMLVGMLSDNNSNFQKQNKHSDLLINVLKFLYQFYSKQHHQYYGYAYYMLLAECNNDTVAKIIEEKDLKLMIDFYKRAYFDNFWNTIIYESINKIIYKSSYQIQAKYIGQLNIELAKTLCKPEEKIDIEQNLYYLSDLIKIGRNYDEGSILKSFIPVLISFKNKINLLSNEASSLKYENIENTNDQALINDFEVLNDNEAWVRSNLLSFFNDLEFFSSRKLQHHKDEITTLYKEEVTSVSILKNVLVKIIPVPSLIQIEEQYNEIVRFKENNNIVENEEIQGFYFSLTLKLAENLFILINDILLFSNRDLEKINLYLKFLVNDVISSEHYECINHFYLEHLIDILIENLTIINSSKLYDLLFCLVKRFDAIIFNRIPNQTIFNKYLLAIFNEVNKTLDLALINELIVVLKSSPNARLYFFNYRDSLFHVFKLLVEKNIISLENKNIKDENYDEVVSTLVEITEIFEKNYDKKFILEQIELNNLSSLYQFEDGIILQTVATNFIFYEDKYWELFKLFYENKGWKIHTVLPFVANEELFLFKSNHIQLVNIFINLFENKTNFSKMTLSDEGGEILVFICNILKCLKHFEDVEVKHKALKLVEKLLGNKNILNFCDYKVIDLTPVDYLLAYILFDFYNPKYKNFLIKLDINTKLSKETGAKIMLMDSLIEFTENKNYGIEIQEIEKFKPVLGDVFYQELINLIDQRLINKNVFDAHYFETVLLP